MDKGSNDDRNQRSTTQAGIIPEVSKKIEALKPQLDNPDAQVTIQTSSTNQQFVGKKQKLTDKPPGFAICPEEPQNLKRSRHSLEKGSGSTTKKDRSSRDGSNHGSNQNSLQSPNSGLSKKS